MTRRDKIVNALILPVLFLAFFMSKAEAQTWDENRLTWDAPTTCTNGQPISNCPVTGYRIERAAVSTGPYVAIGTSQTASFTHTGAAAGVNCYKVYALSATGDSEASQHACKTNVEPTQPNPPTNIRFVTQVVEGMDHSPVYRLTATGTKDKRYSDACGYIPVKSQCEGNVLFSFRDKPFRKVNLADVKQWADCGTSVAGPCS